MNEELQKITETIVSNVKESVSEMNKETEQKIADIKEEIKGLKAYKAWQSEISEKSAKEVIVKTFRDVFKAGITSEEWFNSALDNNIKATYQNTVTATDWKEFVAELFSRDVFYYMEKNPVNAELTYRRLNGKSILLPFYDWGVEAYWVDEWAAYTASKWNTGNTKVEMKKLWVLVTFTDEMLADDSTTETLYNLIIEDAAVRIAAKTEDAVINWSWTFAGIIGATGVGEVSIANLANITYDNLVDLETAVEYDYNNDNNIALMSKATLGQLRKLRDTNWVLTFPTLTDRVPTLMWRRVVKTKALPATVWIIFWNLKDGYYAFERWDYEAVMGYVDGDFKAWKQSLRISERKGWAPKSGKFFAVLKKSA